jgi:uncharacterized protein
LYFEALWHFFLEQDERVELLGHNLPVRDSGQTIGEFDCLYYCRERRRHFHLELAVKFYLGLPQPGAEGIHSHWNRWLGPGSRDRLDLKMDRLLQHQVQLGSHPKARTLLEELGIEKLELEMEIKGRLFNCAAQPLPPPFGYNSELDLCLWTATAQLEDHSHCAVLDKRHWLTAVTPASKLSGVELPLSATGQPRLIATLDREGYELQRFFLVPEHWPDGS